MLLSCSSERIREFPPLSSSGRASKKTEKTVKILSLWPRMEIWKILYEFICIYGNICVYIYIYIYINTHIHTYTYICNRPFADFFLHHSGCHLWQMFHIKFILWVCERFSSCAGSAYISLYSHITLVESRNTFNYWVNLLFDKSFSLQTLFNVRCRQSN